MPKKVYKAEQIVAKQRRFDTVLSQGKPVAAACCEAGGSKQSYSGMNVSTEKSSTASAVVVKT